MRTIIITLLVCNTAVFAQTRVGIGTTSPENSLTIKGNGETVGISSAAGLVKGGFYVDDAGFWLQTHNNAPMYFAVSNSPYPLMSLRTDNRVEIGSTSAIRSSVLTIARGTGVDGALAIEGSTNVSHFYYGSAEDTYIRGGKAGSYVIINDIPGGAVGINTGAPQISLHVKQSFPGFLDGIMLEYDANNKWAVGILNSNKYVWRAYRNGNFPGTAYIDDVTGNYYTFSDSSRKRNVASLKETAVGINTLMQLRPVQYKFKDAPDSVNGYGFISQEVAKILPGFVSDLEGTKMMAYQNFIPLLTQSIQDQQKEIETLKQELYALKLALAQTGPGKK